MTEDELDLLASAYLDGEATPEEVALVERDPDLLARVEAMRAVSGQLGAVPSPPPDLKEQHLAAALAAFDGAAPAVVTAASATDAVDDNVLDFKARAQGQKSADRIKRRRSAGVGGLPSWLPAAAVFVLVAGGVIALVNSQSDDFDAATDTAAEVSADASTEAGSSDGEAETAEMTQSAAGSDESGLAPEADMADDATGDEAAADDEEAMEEAEEAAEAEPAGGDADSAAPTTTTARSEFIAQEPVFIIDVPLSDLDLGALISDLPELIDPVESNCAERLELGPDFEPSGYVPVLVAGLPAELFGIVDSAGEETGRLFEAESCTPIE